MIDEIGDLQRILLSADRTRSFLSQALPTKGQWVLPLLSHSGNSLRTSTDPFHMDLHWVRFPVAWDLAQAAFPDVPPIDFFHSLSVLSSVHLLSKNHQERDFIGSLSGGPVESLEERVLFSEDLSFLVEAVLAARHGLLATVVDSRKEYFSRLMGAGMDTTNTHSAVTPAVHWGNAHNHNHHHNSHHHSGCNDLDPVALWSKEGRTLLHSEPFLWHSDEDSDDVSSSDGEDGETISAVADSLRLVLSAPANPMAVEHALRQVSLDTSINSSEEAVGLLRRFAAILDEQQRLGEAQHSYVSSEVATHFDMRHWPTLRGGSDGGDSSDVGDNSFALRPPSVVPSGTAAVNGNAASHSFATEHSYVSVSKQPQAQLQSSSSNQYPATLAAGVDGNNAGAAGEAVSLSFNGSELAGGRSPSLPPTARSNQQRTSSALPFAATAAASPLPQDTPSRCGTTQEAREKNDGSSEGRRKKKSSAAKYKLRNNDGPSQGNDDGEEVFDGVNKNPAACGCCSVM